MVKTSFSLLITLASSSLLSSILSSFVLIVLFESVSYTNSSVLVSYKILLDSLPFVKIPISLISSSFASDSNEILFSEDIIVLLSFSLLIFPSSTIANGPVFELAWVELSGFKLDWVKLAWVELSWFELSSTLFNLSSSSGLAISFPNIFAISNAILLFGLLIKCALFIFIASTITILLLIFIIFSTIGLFKNKHAISNSSFKSSDCFKSGFLPSPISFISFIYFSFFGIFASIAFIIFFIS